MNEQISLYDAQKYEKWEKDHIETLKKIKIEKTAEELIKELWG